MKSIFINGANVLVFSVSLLHAQPCVFVSTELVNQVQSEGDAFGWAVDAQDNIIVIGIPGEDYLEGSVLVYRRDGSQWIQDTLIQPLQGEENDRFGSSVSISGNFLLIGSPGDDDNGSQSGAAYMYSYDGTTWHQLSKILPDDGHTGDSFGSSVSLSGDRAIIGATRHDENGTNSGAAYIYHYNGKNFAQQTKLIASDGEAYDSFGKAIAIQGDTAIVGAPEDDDRGNSSGSAYVFHFDGIQWNEQEKIVPVDASPSDFFAESVAMDSGKVIFGAIWNDAVAANGGAAYVYVDNGTQWVQEAMLVASDTTLSDQFGVSVDISGDTAVIGANQADSETQNSGAIYLFEFDEGSWSQVEKLTSTDSVAGDELGRSIAVSDDAVIAGASAHNGSELNSGLAMVFNRDQAGSADLNFDGMLNFFDISYFLAAYSENHPDADFLEDGSYNFFDVSEFLMAFTHGCP